MKKLIFDVSSYQGLINYDKLVSEPTQEELDALGGIKEKPVVVFARMGISWGYDDKYFERNYAGIKSVNLIPAIYHVHRPDASALEQVDKICRKLDYIKYDGTETFCIDEELSLGLDANTVMDEYFKTYDLVTKRGIKNISYSAKWFIDVYMKNTPRFAEPKWMLAAYGLDEFGGYREKPTEEFLQYDIPDRIPQQNVLIHQFTDRFANSAGKLYGMESYGLDASRWIGTDKEFEYYFGQVTDPIEEPTGIKTVSVGDSHLALRDENMEIRGWLETGCKVNLVGETSKGIGKDGEVHTYQKCTIDCNLADEYLV